MNKYKNKKVKIDHNVFDSIKEANRFKYLKWQEDQGHISNLELQPKFVLMKGRKIVDPTKKSGYSKIADITYKADFQYNVGSCSKPIVEDVKGYKTAMYNLKKRMFLIQYSDQYEFYES